MRKRVKKRLDELEEKVKPKGEVYIVMPGDPMPDAKPGDIVLVIEVV